jgi:hypothetical protein
MPASLTSLRDYSAEQLRRLAKNAEMVSERRQLLSLATVLDGMARVNAGVSAACPRVSSATSRRAQRFRQSLI